MDKSFSITLNEEQYNNVADALEFVSRFLSGQVEAFNLPAGLRFSDRYTDRSESIDQALSNLKANLFPELYSSQFYGIGASQSEPIARGRAVLYEVYRTMLEFRTKQQMESGEQVGYSVYAHPGLNYTGLPKPLIQIPENRLETPKSVSKIAENVSKVAK